MIGAYPLSSAVTNSPRGTYAPGTFRLRFAKLAPNKQMQAARNLVSGPMPRSAKPKTGIKTVPLRTLSVKGVKGIA